LEYLVTLGENNDAGHDARVTYRAYRVPSASGLSFAEPMDATYNVQVWQGNHWVAGEYVFWWWHAVHSAPGRERGSERGGAE
jgi:hypothetical protein